MLVSLFVFFSFHSSLCADCQSPLGAALRRRHWRRAIVEPGDSRTVTKDGVNLVYKCAAYPASGWCPLDGYEPGSGWAWQQAWTLQGSCDSTKTFTATASPSSSLTNQGGAAASSGCYPAYEPGGTYSKSSAVSQATTTTTPIAYIACTVSPTCTTGWIKTGGVSTTVKYNFVCSSDDWCGSVGYAPGDVYSYLAWTKDATPCSVSCFDRAARCLTSLSL